MCAIIDKKKGAGSLLRTVRNGLPGLVWFAKWDVSKSESSKCRHTHTHMVEWHRAAPGMIHVHTKGKGEQKKKRTTTPPPSAVLLSVSSLLGWVMSCLVGSIHANSTTPPPLLLASPATSPCCKHTHNQRRAASTAADSIPLPSDYTPATHTHTHT